MKSDFSDVSKNYFLVLGLYLFISVIGCSKGGESGKNDSGGQTAPKESIQPAPTVTVETAAAESEPEKANIFEDAKNFLKYLDIRKSESQADFFSYNNSVDIQSNKLKPDTNSPRDLNLIISIIKESDNKVDFIVYSRCDFKHKTVMEFYGVSSVLKQLGNADEPPREYFSLDKDGKISLHCVPGYGTIIPAGEFKDDKLQIKFMQCFKESNPINPGILEITKQEDNRIKVLHKNLDYFLDGRTVTCSANLISQ